MSHNYDDLVIGEGATDYFRLDTDVDDLVNKAFNVGSGNAVAGGSPTDILPGTNNVYSRYFNGTDSYMDFVYGNLQEGYTFPNSMDMTVECWIKTGTVNTSQDFTGIVVKSGSFGLCLNYGKPAFFTQLSGQAKVVAAGSSVLSNDTVYHLMGTYHHTNGHLIMYVNGSSVGTADTGSTGRANDQNGGSLAIGSWDTSVLFFEGYISNVALYDVTLSGTIANEHYTWNS